MKRILLFASLIVTFSLFPYSLLSQTRLVKPTVLVDHVDQKKMKEWVDMEYNSMTLEQRIGQLIMPIIWPSTSSRNIDAAKRLVRETAIGGVLYQKGFVGKQYEMNRILQSEAKIPLLISLDGEFGLWMRLKDAPRYPRAMALGHIKDPRYIYWYGRQIAEQCKIMGIQVNFAPDLDINNNPDNPVIGTRSFGENPADVISAGLAYAAGLEDGGVLSCAKHFPGHGNTNVDSHKALPVISGSKKQLYQIELKPFQHYINGGYGSVMVGHLQVPAFESKPHTPSSMSYAIITDLLINKLHFGGLIFTDGMEMNGMQIPGDYQIGTRALKAGVDILLGPTNPQTIASDVIRAIKDGYLTEKDIEQKCRRVLEYKYALIINQENTKVYKPTDIRKVLNTKHFTSFCDKLWFQSIQIKHGLDYLPIALNDSTAVLQLGVKSQTDFGRQLKSKGVVKQFFYPVPSEKKEQNLLDDLAGFNTIVISLATKYPERFSSIVNKLISSKRVVLCVLNTPYIYNKLSLKEDPQVLVNAFEACSQAQIACANKITSPQMEYELKLSAKDEELYQQAMKRALGTHRSVIDSTQLKDRFSFEYRNNISSFKFAYKDDYKVVALKNKVDEIVTKAIEDGAMPGCQIVALHKGTVIYDGCFGSLTYDKKKSVTNELMYDLASVTKAAATTPAVMLMIGDKKLSLKTKVQDILSSFKGTKVGSLTIKELLLHRSGLPAGINFYKDLIDPKSYPYPLISFKPLPGYVKIDTDAWGYEAFRFNPNYISITESEDYPNLFAKNIWVSKNFKEKMMSRIAGCKLASRGRYVYSDINFILLQQMVEKVSGMSLDQLMETRIYKPMEARIMFNPIQKGLKPEQCAPTQIDRFIRKQVIQGTVDDESAACLGGCSGNAGLYASAEEFAKLMLLYRNHGMYNGKQLIDRKVFDTFINTKDRDNLRFLGFDKQRARNLNYIARSASQNTYGHTGFTGTCFWVDPDNDVIFIFLSNRTYPDRTNKRIMSMKIRQLLHQAVYDAFGI